MTAVAELAVIISSLLVTWSVFVCASSFVGPALVIRTLVVGWSLAGLPLVLHALLKMSEYRVTSGAACWCVNSAWAVYFLLEICFGKSSIGMLGLFVGMQVLCVIVSFVSLIVSFVSLFQQLRTGSGDRTWIDFVAPVSVILTGVAVFLSLRDVDLGL